ncbi:MFS transporter, partial [Arthrobacter deserti]|nr:MFS transporter [Arthrobacter deserti]
LAVLGLGLGLNLQILVLVVQNSFPLRQVGTATAAHNFFRQTGATLGSAVVGSLFAHRLAGLLAGRLPADAAASTGGGNSVAPELVHGLPGPAQAVIVQSYNESLMPLFLLMVPLAALAAVLCLFVAEKPLATSLEPDVLPEAAAEGSVLIAADPAGDPEATTALRGGRG